MENSEANPPKPPALRHRCSACFKQYKKKEHLVAHMKASYHSVHQPKCGVCQKHCKSFESLREHLLGPLSKSSCSVAFADRGCEFCLKLFESPNYLNEHRETCRFPAPAPLEAAMLRSTEYQVDFTSSTNSIHNVGAPEAVALDCEMVCGGSDGSLDLCGRVCLIDEDENLIFQTYVKPEIPVTNYRYEITGISEEHLRDAMPLKEVREKILEILYNGESTEWLQELNGVKAKVLAGHDLEHDFNCLKLYYPDHLLRDTAKYRPLLKTNFVSHSLKYLTRTYLGYDIQTGVHDPYEDCVSIMRLYKRMRVQNHPEEEIGKSIAFHHSQTFTNRFNAWTPAQLEKMNSDELYEISRSNYRCWCLDSKQALQL